MDNVYRVFQKGQDPKTGAVVTSLKLKAIITQPVSGDALPTRTVVILGAAYAGESEVERVDISVDGGTTWSPADFISPHESYSWRQWQYVWKANEKGEHMIMARATDKDGNPQPPHAQWNVLGYGNNGVYEHAVKVNII
ncbi:MAG: hypothetical protein AB9866_21830 [Syntrophobacteraceae bacterium]